VILDVGISKRLERDVRLLADLVPSLENPDTSAASNFLASCLLAVAVVLR
jgi:hypothetical protein